MKPARANQFFIFHDLIDHMARAIRDDGVTVERFIYEPNRINRLTLEFEVRVTRVNGSPLPAIRRKRSTTKEPQR